MGQEYTFTGTCKKCGAEMVISLEEFDRVGKLVEAKMKADKSMDADMRAALIVIAILFSPIIILAASVFFV